MQGEGHANNRVHGRHVAILQDRLTVIQELLLQSLVGFLNFLSGILRIKRFNGLVVSGPLHEEVLQCIHAGLKHHGLVGLGKQVDAGLSHNVASALSEALRIVEDGIILITTAHGRSRSTITYNARHILVLLFRIYIENTCITYINRILLYCYSTQFGTLEYLRVLWTNLSKDVIDLMCCY